MGLEAANSDRKAMKSKWLSKPSNRLAVGGFVLALVGAIWAIVIWVIPSPASSDGERLLFVCDTKGTPQQIALIGRDGAAVFSDQQGLARVPKNWIGRSVSIRNPSDWRELVDVKLVADEDGRVRITLTK